MKIIEVKLRNGELAPFDRSKIENALTLACDAVAKIEKDFILKMTDDILSELEDLFAKGLEKRIPTVEEIQDLVEKHLMAGGYFEVAKAYIIYRGKRQEERTEYQEKLVEQFEKNSMNVLKTDGSRELFDIKKIK